MTQNPVYYNDNNPYCCNVLRKNITLGNLPKGTVDERDIRDVTAADLVGYAHIHLFAGIGGIPLGFQWANFPKHISILTGGFPCQDISNAGKRAGIEGERSGLWREMYRLICDVRPQYVFVENVAALLGRGIDTVLADLAACGYDAEWQCLSAAQFGAPHIRERVFIVAYSKSQQDWWICQRGIQPDLRTSYQDVAVAPSNGRRPRRPECQGQQGSVFPKRSGTSLADPTSQQWNRRGDTRSGRIRLANGGQDVPNPDRQGLAVGQVFGSDTRQKLAAFKRVCSTGAGQWAVEPLLDRVVNGVPRRVDRLRGLGNAIVPQITQYIAGCIIAHAQADVEVA